MALVVLAVYITRQRKGQASIGSMPHTAERDLSEEEADEMALERLAAYDGEPDGYVLPAPTTGGARKKHARNTARNTVGNTVRNRTISDPIAISAAVPSPWDALGREVQPPVAETSADGVDEEGFQTWKNVKVGGRRSARPTPPMELDVPTGEVRHSSFSQPIKDGE